MARIIRIACFVVFTLLSLHLGCDWDPAEDTIHSDFPRPTYVYPPNNATGQSRTPVLVWNRYRHSELNVNHYELSLWSGPGDDDVVLDRVVVYDSMCVCPETLDPETEYYWWVMVVGQYHEAALGIQWHFTTGSGFNNPPVSPFDPVPAEGSSGNFLYQVLSWDCIDPDGDDLTYDVWLRRFLVGDEVLIADGISEKTADPGGLEPETTYQWRVVAFDAHGDSAVGPSWRFKTIPASNKPPIEPWGPTPADGATNMLLDVTLSWHCEDPEDDPITYRVSLGIAGGNLTVIASDLTDTSFEVTGLDPYTEYEWLVTATDDHSHVMPGPIWSFTTGDGVPVREVFAALMLKRTITYTGGNIIRFDEISARFDSLYAPDVPINPLLPASVSCGGFDLTVHPGSQYYSYTDLVAGYFLNPGTNYIFTIAEGDGVPSLTSDLITFPACGPYITSPAPFSEVSLDGFDLEWHTFCSGTIDITIMDMNGDSTGVYIRTEDDGFYAFTADDLAPIGAGAYQLQIVLINENLKTITAQGYDPRSRLWARTLSVQYVNVQQ
jgi:hypothetical protein